MKIIDCPRDAMQGIKEFIPTEKKVAYINQLLKVGFDTLDFGSFVSPKAIPQMADTKELLSKIDLSGSKTRLLAIVANTRGAEEAVSYEAVNYLGFPFSISETFQIRNTNSTMEQSLITVESIQKLSNQEGKKMVVYLSMGFGNPYGDPWNEDVIIKWTSRFSQMGIDIIALSDTVGVAEPKSISHIFSTVIPEFPNVEIGAHLHTTPDTWREKVDAAYKAGCKRFDGALKGFGGCPMAKDDLTGNMPTENLVSYFEDSGVDLNLNKSELEKAINLAAFTFPVV